MSKTPQQYYVMKDSGIDWIGEIPEHWKVKPLKRALASKLKYGANESAELDDRNLPRYIRITDFGDDGLLKEKTFKSLPLEIAKDFPLYEGDILFARSGATVGKTFQYTGSDGIACYAGYLIRATTQDYLLNSRFLYFYTKSTAYEEWKNLTFTQATIQNIGADKYQYLLVTLPPISEQKAIVTYLDKATQQIDQSLKLKRDQLKILNKYRKSLIHEKVTRGLNPNVKLKPSGIDWIGDIPEHWTVRKIKTISTLKSGDGITSLQISKEGLYPVYGGNGLRGFTDSYTHSGDFALIGRQGALCGNINYASGNFFATEHAVVCNPIVNYPLTWFGELLTSMNLNQYSNAAAQPGLAVDKIKNLLIPLPPKSEQEAIANYLDKATAKIDAAKKNLEDQISTLTDYRKSLIHECVTGQKRVYFEE